MRQQTGYDSETPEKHNTMTLRANRSHSEGYDRLWRSLLLSPEHEVISMAQFCSICGKPARDTAKFCQACGAPFVQVLQAGSTLDRGRYEVKSALKSGGMGAIYLLWDSRLERDCALKEMLSLSHDPTEMKEFRERFRNEALTLSKLSHPNLPPIHDHFEENHHCYLVMEYVDGDDLESLLAATPSKYFPEEKVLQWALTICTILEYLHSRNPLILYRDLKP